MADLCKNSKRVQWTRDHGLQPSDLEHLGLLQGLSEEQLRWLLERIELGHLETGDCCFSEGDPADHLFMAVDGKLQFQFESDGIILYSSEVGTDEAVGMLPFSRMSVHTGMAIALVPSRVIRVHSEYFESMNVHLPTLVKRLVGQLSDRVREATRMQQQREKMMALGTLSAGLAHELNNPAAAIRSSTKELIERLSAMPERVIRLGRHHLLEEELLSLGSLPTRLKDRQNRQLKPLERSRLEDELADWMEDKGVSNAWRLAETFVDAGFQVADLEEVAAKTPQEAMSDTLCWVEGHTAIFNLVLEVNTAVERISSLVASIKGYSHMDRSPTKQLTQVDEGLETTLTMLGHKLKKKNVQVDRLYAPDLPPVMAFPGELNQVWTNLLDNAIDALPSEGGVIRIETRLTHGALLVTLTDNGSGIPPAILDRIYEPFFTTKPLGEGTGLGLDITHRIITRRHQGHIEVESRPGCTRFQVALPLGAGTAAPAGEPSVSH